MEEKILEIIRTDQIFLAGHPEKCAKEIADMNRKFIEWIIFVRDIQTRMPIDELFNYWYDNIREK